MAITIVRSTDVGAPVLTNVAGTLIAVLDYCLVTKAGWTKPFTGTNLAAYKQPAGSNGMYLRVDDTGNSPSALGNTAFRGFESMTSINEATLPAFPTVAQMPNGMYLYKANSSTATEYFFITNGKMFYFLTNFDGGGLNWQGFCFGDISSYRAGDQFATFISGNTSTNATTSTPGFQNLSGVFNQPVAYQYIARAYNQLGGSVMTSKITDYAGLGVNSYLCNGQLTYPTPIDGTLALAPTWVGETTTGRRGLLPGIWNHGHACTTFSSHDIITGNGDVAGRTFEYFRLYTAANGAGVLIETSDTWN